VIARILQNWSLVKNQYIYATGVLVSAKQILASLERWTNSTWSAGYSDVEDCVREGLSRVERGYPGAGMSLLKRSVLYDQKLDAVRAFHNRDAKRILLLEPETVHEIVGEALHSFKHRGKPRCGCD
jgi:hypothetical protein